MLRHRLDVVDEEVVDRGTGDIGHRPLVGFGPLCGPAHDLVHHHAGGSSPLERPEELTLLLHEDGPHIHGAGAEELVDPVREVPILLGQNGQGDRGHAFVVHESKSEAVGLDGHPCRLERLCSLGQICVLVCLCGWHTCPQLDPLIAAAPDAQVTHQLACALHSIMSMLMPRVCAVIEPGTDRHGVLHAPSGADLDPLLELVAVEERPSQQWTVDKDAVTEEPHVLAGGPQPEHAPCTCTHIRGQDLIDCWSTTSTS